MTTPNHTAQDFLFQRIREMLPAQTSLADEVSEILHVSNDSAYRRIRNETPLLLEEAKLLCDHFGLSLDHLFQVRNNSVLFQTVQIDSKNSFENYLRGILGQLKATVQLSNCEVIYLTKDIPLFHLFTFDPVFCFRYFFWMKTIIQHPDFQDAAFSFSAMQPNILALGKEIIKTYNLISSTEIWNTECMNSTIIKVEYYKSAGYFSSASDIKIIYESVEESLNHIKDQVEWGVKFLPGEKQDLKKKNFDFFYNRVILGDNTILVVTENNKTVYLNYEVLNYMITSDTAFCDGAHREMQNLMRTSTLISQTSEKQRNIFFGILLAKINERKKHL